MELKKELDFLKIQDLNKQLTFCYLICVRLLPNYNHFFKKYKWGNVHVLKQAILFINQNLLTPGHMDVVKIQNFINDVDFNTPDTEDFSDISVSSALDACTAISGTLQFMIDGDSNGINDISSYAIDTVDMYIPEIMDLNSMKGEQYELAILNHPFMQREINMQKQIIKYLSSVLNLKYSDIEHLLVLQQNNNRSNIDLQ